MLKSFFQDHLPLFLFQVFLLIIVAYPLLAYNKLALFLKLNDLHHPFLDILFCWSTLLGTTSFYCLFLAAFAFIQKDSTIIFVGISSFVIMSIIVHGLKGIELFEQARPITQFSSIGIQLRLVQGVTPLTYWSFPSGHTATIFAAIWLVYLYTPFKSSYFSLLLILIACTVAYSRIYLCHHFLRDIYVGSIIGSTTTIVVYLIFKAWPIAAWLNQYLSNFMLHYSK